MPQVRRQEVLCQKHNARLKDSGMTNLLLLFAQDAAVPQWLVPIIRDLGGIGFLAWFGWYMTAKTMPNLVAEFRAEMKSEREANDSRENKLLAVLGDQQKVNHEDSVRLRDALHGLKMAIQKQGLPVNDDK